MIAHVRSTSGKPALRIGDHEVAFHGQADQVRLGRAPAAADAPPFRGTTAYVDGTSSSWPAASFDASGSATGSSPSAAISASSTG